MSAPKPTSTDETSGGPAPAEWTPGQLARARRVQMILYIVMITFIVAPLVAWWLLK